MRFRDKCFPVGPVKLSAFDVPRVEMAQSAKEKGKHSELSGLLELHGRLMQDLQRVRDDLVAPNTTKMARRYHSETGSIPEGMGPVTAAVEEAIRTIKLSEAHLRTEMGQSHPQAQIDGIDNMPMALSRFIAERSMNPDFQYEVFHDENRGWIVKWKEYWNGNVRGSGRFYERPYAWLDD